MQEFIDAGLETHDWSMFEPQMGDLPEAVAIAIETGIDAYRRATRILNTPEEVDQLPVGSVILDSAGYVAYKEVNGPPGDWQVSLHKFSKNSTVFSYPVEVLK